MSTWISRTVLALLAATVLGAAGAGALPYAADLSALAGEGAHARISMVSLSQGHVMLAAPQDYCIDRQSVQRGANASFAMIARCDTLGVRGPASRARPVAVITVTVGTSGDHAETPDAAELTRAIGVHPSQVGETRERGGLSLVRLTGVEPPFPGVATEHWRGVFTVNGRLVALSLYAPKGGRALGGYGAALLGEVARVTRDASVTAAREAASTPVSAD